MKQTFCVLLLSSLQVACSSSKILRDHDYERSLISFRQSDFETARADFPQKEDGGFITSIEKSWIDLWRAKFDSKPLMKHTDGFEGRKFTRVSREAGTFLYAESEEGYIPSEAEVAVLHLVAAAHLLQEGNMESARVEIKRADEVLGMAWDDPSLRIWSAAMWAAIGEWWEAQVDFRRAYQMTGNKEFLKWADRRAPPEFVVRFHGVGPVLKWSDGSFSPGFEAPPVTPEEPTVVSTMPWYDRHLKRDHELHEMMLKSNYMAQYMGSETTTFAERAVTNTLTAIIRAVGIAAGTAIAVAGIYVMSQGGSDAGEAGTYIMGAGFGVASATWKGASEAQSDFDRTIKKDRNERNKNMRTYRLVRYMPDFISVSLKDEPCARCARVKLPRSSTTSVTMVLQP